MVEYKMAGRHFRLSDDLPAVMDGRFLTCNVFDSFLYGEQKISLWCVYEG
jgi:hypothetical protein